MSTVKRFDRIQINPTKRTQEGFLKIDGSKIARTGIQVYRRADGSQARELRESDQVFDTASMKAFSLLPLTNTHPATLLDSTNAKAHAVGAVGEASKLDDKWLTASLSVWDESAVRSIEDGRAQLSVGYTCKLDETPGEHPVHGKYDARQIGIVPNHLAIVDFARAGNEARLRLDGTDGEMVTDAITGAISGFENDVLPSTQVRESEQMPIKMKLDGGHEIEVQSANDQAAIERHVESSVKASEKAAKKALEKADEADKAKTAAEKELADKAKALDTLQGKFVTLTAKTQTDAAEMLKLEGSEISYADLRDEGKRTAFFSAAVDKRAQARTALVIEAQKHLGTKEKLDGKTDLDVKKMVVAKLNKSAKLDGQSADYVQACFDMAIADAKPVAAIDAARAAATAPTLVVTDAAPATDGKSAYEAMRLRTLQANPKNQVR